MKFALRKKSMLLLLLKSWLSNLIEVGKKDLVFLLVRVLGHLNLSAALDYLLDVNGIEGMSFVVKDFLQLTKRSSIVPISSCSLPITTLAVFIILFNLSLSCFKRLPPQQASPKVSVLLIIEV